MVVGWVKDDLEDQGNQYVLHHVSIPIFARRAEFFERSNPPTRDIISTISYGLALAHTQ